LYNSIGINYYGLNEEPMGGANTKPSSPVMQNQLTKVEFGIPDNVSSYEVFLPK
jgi:hypothetical protein